MEDGELTQDQWATLFTNGSVNATVDGAPTTLNIESDQLQLTEAQAEVLYHALSEANFEVYAAAETARRTQEILKERFDLDSEESYLEFE